MMTDCLNTGAASCAYSLGCYGVTQEHLERFAKAVAQRCYKLCATEWNGDSDTYEAAQASNECAQAIAAEFGLVVQG